MKACIGVDKAYENYSAIRKATFSQPVSSKILKGLAQDSKVNPLGVCTFIMFINIKTNYYGPAMPSLMAKSGQAHSNNQGSFVHGIVDLYGLFNNKRTN